MQNPVVSALQVMRRGKDLVLFRTLLLYTDLKASCGFQKNSMCVVNITFANEKLTTARMQPREGKLTSHYPNLPLVTNHEGLNADKKISSLN